MGKTEDNLKEAYAGESQASTRYIAFADRAERDGYPQVAKLFRALSLSETIHARNHLETMDGVKSTEENLKESIAGERMEHVHMYANFIEQANQEGNKRAALTFKWARNTEMAHESMFRSVLDALKSGSELPAINYHVCQLCGFTVEDEAPEKCPICGSVKLIFMEVD